MHLIFFSTSSIICSAITLFGLFLRHSLFIFILTCFIHIYTFFYSIYMYMQALHCFLGKWSPPSVFSGVRAALYIVFCVVFCRSLFVLFIWPMYCLSFFKLWFLITLWISLNFSRYYHLLFFIYSNEKMIYFLI